MRTLHDAPEVVSAEVTFVSFHGRHVAHMPRVIAASNGIDAVFLLNLGHPIKHDALINNGRWARAQVAVGNPRIIWHAVTPAAPPLALRLL